MKAFTHKDAFKVGAILADVARTEIMPRFTGVMLNSVREKTSTFDVVMDADEAAEREISARLRKLFPSAAFIGEEAAANEPEILAQIAKAELAFIIDPIDGTKNFSSGIPLFGMMVAATVRGEVVMGIIHDPVCRETSFAVRGLGAWRQGEDLIARPLKVAAPLPVSQMHGVIGTNFLPEPTRTIVALNLSKMSLSFWMRCAAQEYRMAAAGHCHVLLYNKLMPWDHAAGWLLHKEAGGYSAHFDGSLYRPDHFTGGLICAPDKDSWELVRQALLEPSQGSIRGAE